MNFLVQGTKSTCRCIHGILVSLTLSGDGSCLRYHLLTKSILPTTWKRTNSSADDSEALFLFPDFERSPEGYVSHPGCLNFITRTACLWIFSKNLCYMGEREISQHTLQCCSGQQTGSPQLQQPQRYHRVPWAGHSGSGELLSMQGVFAKLQCRRVRAELQTFLNWMEKEKRAK